MNLDEEPLRHPGHLLRRAQHRHVAIWLRDVSAETTSVQFATLTLLDRYPHSSQRELGTLLDLDRSTIADLVTRMVGRGLIEREDDPADRRKKRLALTEAGREQLAYLRPRVDAIEPVLTGALSAPERAQLRRLVLKLLQG